MDNLIRTEFVKKENNEFFWNDKLKNKNIEEIKNDIEFNKYFYKSNLPIIHKDFNINYFDILGTDEQRNINRKTKEFAIDFCENLIERVLNVCSPDSENNKIKNKNLFLYGDTRSGKTILACGICNQIIYEFYVLNNLYKNGCDNLKNFIINAGLNEEIYLNYDYSELKLKFYLATEILTLYRPTFKEQFIKKEELYNCQVLFIESLESIANSNDPMKTQVIFELLQSRYLSKKLTIITSRLDLSSLCSEFKNDYLIDMLDENYEKLQLKGPGKYNKERYEINNFDKNYKKIC